MQIFMIVTSQKGVIDMRAGFIGAGKVGFSLGKYLKENGVEITGYFSKSPESAKSAADFTNTKLYKSIENILSDSDTLFITVPDGQISKVWDYMKNQYPVFFEFRQFLFHIRFPHSFFPVPYTHDLKIKIFVIAAVRFHQPFFLMVKTSVQISIRYIPYMQ